ncbi:MAG: radical SAM protein [Bacteroidota bacterium]
MKFINRNIVQFVKDRKASHLFLVRIKHLFNRYPKPKIDFPEMISIEISSICNLSCSHCPPQMKEFRTLRRKHNHINYDLFNKLMDEIDAYGTNYIALHKDGEPLIHPEIEKILMRVKQNREHNVYITTNAQNLDSAMADLLISSRINSVNFSVGASSSRFYEKVRGKNYYKVIDNILHFIEKVKTSNWKPKVSVQIINLPEHQEMKSEIDNFRRFWKDFDVSISVWEKLTWGVLDGENVKSYRYPCYSLWHSFNINSNGEVTACCMDWKQELIIGSVFQESIKTIWFSKRLKELRQIHLLHDETKLPACTTCNYWKWQPMLLEYPL